jgi:hypothetical protein
MMIALMIIHVCLHNLDEHIFNKNRSHSKYETLSSVTDGIFFLLPLLMATFVTYSENLEIVYKAIAGISMVSIITNEIFYKNLEVKERVIHACLYVLHPILLFNFFESWQNNYFQENTNFWMIQLLYVGFGIKSFLYQIIYWNYIHEGPKT